MTATATPPRNAPPFGAFEYYPDNLEWSTQMIRLFGYASIGGADFSEVHDVAKDVPVGDVKAWREGFLGLAKRLDQQAQVSAQGGHTISARDTWLRASVAYRFAGQLDALDGTNVPFVNESRRCFRDAAALSEVEIEAVDLPFGSSALAGYRIGAARSTGKSPAVIVSGGIDAYSEEMYLKIGKCLSDRGYTVLLVDGPGQGESLHRGIHGRADYEVACKVAVDYLQARDDVDAERIAFLGSSLGGYYALRAAGFETRLKACIAWAVAPDFTAKPGKLTGATQSRLGQLQAFLGVDDGRQAIATIATFDLTGVVERIACPMLILHGESDQLVPVERARQIYGQLTVADKTLITYPEGTPGCVHCQMDSVPAAQRDMCDWLDDRLQPTDPTGSARAS